MLDSYFKTQLTETLNIILFNKLNGNFLLIALDPRIERLNFWNKLLTSFKISFLAKIITVIMVILKHIAQLFCTWKS